VVKLFPDLLPVLQSLPSFKIFFKDLTSTPKLPEGGKYSSRTSTSPTKSGKLS